MVNSPDTGDSGYLTPDALVALRNSRLWEAHAQRCSGPERDSALRIAAQWTATFQSLKATTPGDRRVALRRGDRDVNHKETAYLLFVLVGTLAVVIYVVYSHVAT